MSIIAPLPATSALLEEAQYLVQRWSPSLEAQAHACILESAATNDMAALLLLRDRGGFSIEVGLVESLAAGHLDLYEECIRQRNELMSQTKRNLWLMAAGGSEAIWIAAARCSASTAVLERVSQTLSPPHPVSGKFMKQLYATATLRNALFVRARLGNQLPPLDATDIPVGRDDMLRAVLADEKDLEKEGGIGAQKLANALLAAAVSGNALALVRQLCSGTILPLPAASALGRRAAAALGGAALPVLLEMPGATWPAWALPAHAAAGDYDTVDVLLNHLDLAVVDDDEPSSSTALKVYLSAARGHVEYQLRGKSARVVKSESAAAAALERLRRAMAEAV